MEGWWKWAERQLKIIMNSCEKWNCTENLLHSSFMQLVSHNFPSELLSSSTITTDYIRFRPRETHSDSVHYGCWSHNSPLFWKKGNKRAQVEAPGVSTSFAFALICFLLPINLLSTSSAPVEYLPSLLVVFKIFEHNQSLFLLLFRITTALVFNLEGIDCFSVSVFLSQVKLPARYWTKRSPSSSPDRKLSNLPLATPLPCPVKFPRLVSMTNDSCPPGLKVENDC